MIETELVWPPGLVQPERPPYLVYLDTNHWIGIAKALLRRSDATRYSRLLETLRRATEDGSVRLVLSGPLMEEILQITDPRQRRDIAAAVEELGAFHYLVSGADIQRHELQASLDAMTGTVGRSFRPIAVVGARFLNSFGLKGDISVVDGDGNEVTATVPTQLLDEIERRGHRLWLEGPSDEDLPALLASGFVPIRDLPGLPNNLKIEQHFAQEQLDSHWRKGRLEDVVAARELSLELIDELTYELLARGLTLNDFINGREEIRQLIMSMPSTVVTVKMKTHYHRDAHRQWTINDLRDIEAMSVALPYCDFVLTDASARNAIVISKADVAMKTSVPRTPDELARCLDLSIVS